jgi:hypothetical protein
VTTDLSLYFAADRSTASFHKRIQVFAVGSTLMKRLLQIFFAATLLLISKNTCVGDIIVSFAPSNPNPLMAGSAGTIDVLVHSNSGDVLDAFLADISLTPTGGSPAGGLRFSTTQNDAQLAEPSYVFFGQSLSQNVGVIIGTSYTSTDPFDSFSGSDASDDGSAIPLAGNPTPVTLTMSDQLLFRIDLNALAAGTYEIDLLSSSTFVSDQLDFISPPLLYSSTPFSLTVTGTAAVPEPGTFCVLSILTAGATYRRMRRRSRS